MKKKAKVPDSQLGFGFELPAAPPPEAPRPSIGKLKKQDTFGFKLPPPPEPIVPEPEPEKPVELKKTADGSLSLPEALRLDTNLVLMAGAGTGKTHSLVTLCLHLLSGAGQSRSAPLLPERLCLLTFTDKAAGEMRHRVQSLLAGEGHLDVEMRELWVSTFHSSCVRILRRW